MATRTLDLFVNPSDETISVGPLAVRFLVTGNNSAGSIAAFELMVAAGQRLPAPAHSHDHYEETIYGLDGVLTWTVDERALEVIRAAAGGPPDRVKLAEIMRRHGLTPAP